MTWFTRTAAMKGTEGDGMSDLRLRRIGDSWRGYATEVTDAAPDTMASVCFTIVAVTLAEPLRRALDAHLDEHGCGTGDVHDPAYCSGFIHCPGAKLLWDLLPDGDKIMWASMGGPVRAREAAE